MTAAPSSSPAAARPSAFPAVGHAPAKKPRDMRLDFFRGLAMFIILLAHTPLDPWTLWIPARFGFSDATEIFVFCSGMASSLAFGAAYRDHGWPMGTARIGFRIWQVYWAHVGLLLVVALLLWTIDANGWGEAGMRYIARVPIVPLFEDTGPALAGLFTLTWVPNYFDILPMYLVILALVPAVMAAHRAGGTPAAVALVAGLWLATQFGLTNLPSRPWAPEIPWFFNPFGWALVFFSGFFLGMSWIPVPPRSRLLTWLALGVVLLSVPFAWFRIHDGLWLPQGWWLHDWIWAAREATEPLWRKTEMGLFRWLHFISLAYLAWMAVGPRGHRLVEPLRLPGRPGGRWIALAAVVLVATFPWAWAADIQALAPGLDAWLMELLGPRAEAALGTDLFIPGERLGMTSFAAFLALIVLGWAALGRRGRAFVATTGWERFVPVVRKVGTQSLAVFLVSMVLAQAIGAALDVTGRDGWTVGVANACGFGVLILTAYVAGFFKSQPWRRPAPARTGASPAERGVSAASSERGAAASPNERGAAATPAE
ncbi:OpgC domain-containing protein [Albimonas sp. CAU 1670]|uniref:OpgC family protein n=1 Tax=Albimonas sp. CAU 1670 TaxID=3032599 RepID=UPI0023DB8844|nr:OpgC domain-containing protein [Albimonas sp. CAU 1670]MDF2232035.1 OpgC domain-containing protein [Albimonas sp. CAU 1670]